MSQKLLRARASRTFPSIPLLATLLATLIVASPEMAHAQDPEADEPESGSSAGERKKVLVGQLTGAKTTSTRGWIVEGLGADSRFEVVGGEEGAGLKTGADSDAIAEAALGLEADAVILGKSSLGKKGWTADLEIYDGKDGSLIEKVTVEGGAFDKLQSALVGGEAYFAVVDKAVGFPPAEAEPEPEPEPEPEAAPVEVKEVAETPKQPSPLDVMVGARLYSRAFRYTDTLNQLYPGSFAPLTDYNLDAAPMPFLEGHWYPAAHFTNGFLAHVGLTVGYERGIATRVRYLQPTEEDPAVTEEIVFNQTHQLWFVGGRVRIPVSILTLGLGVNYGNHSFALKDSADGSPSGIFPNVSYGHVEMGGDAEIKVGSVLLGARGSFLYLMSGGELATAEWFPNVKGYGVHFGGHVGWAALPALDLLAGLDTRFYGFDFNPVAVDRPAERVAGGATDRYVSAWFGLRFKIPEKGGAAGASAEGESGGNSGDSFDDFD